MRRPSFYHVKKTTLLAVAGCVWLIAGINVARLGILSYRLLPQITWVHLLLSLAVFCAFGLMFWMFSLPCSTAAWVVLLLWPGCCSGSPLSLF